MKFSRAWRGVAVAVITVLTLLVFAACDTVATEEYFDVFGTTASVRSEKKGYAESVREYMQSAELVLSATVDGSDINRKALSLPPSPVSWTRSPWRSSSSPTMCMC